MKLLRKSCLLAFMFLTVWSGISGQIEALDTPIKKTYQLSFPVVGYVLSDSTLIKEINLNEVLVSSKAPSSFLAEMLFGVPLEKDKGSDTRIDRVLQQRQERFSLERGVIHSEYWLYGGFSRSRIRSLSYCIHYEGSSMTDRGVISIIEADNGINKIYSYASEDFPILRAAETLCYEMIEQRYNSTKIDVPKTPLDLHGLYVKLFNELSLKDRCH